MKILLAADVHLGRLPARLMVDNRDAAALGPARAFKNLIAAAEEHQVAAVVIAGDLVDDDRDFYEAYTDLHRGAEQLLAAGIRLIVVAGNHDVDVLPRLVQELPNVEFLGKDGRWQFTEVRAGDTRIDILGWSFPGRTVTYSALPEAHELLKQPRKNPVYLVAHGALNEHQSPYHPIKQADIEALPVAGWWLGHIHQPHDIATTGSGYLGSLSALRRSEQGWRGAWLFDVQAGMYERVHVSPLRYETISVDATTITDLANTNQAVLQHVREHHQHAGIEPPVAAVGVHLHFTGRHPARTELRKEVAKAHAPGSALSPIGNVTYFVTGTSWDVAGQYNLTALASGVGTQAELATRLLALERPASEEAQALIRAFRAQAEHESALGRRHYEQLPNDFTDEELANVLRDALTNVLDHVVSEVG